MTSSHTYPLLLSDAERTRYRALADRALAEEGALWQRAGIAPGARVADVGCGPGAMLPALARAVGPSGRVVGVDADPDAVASARSYADACDLDDVQITVGRADDTGLTETSHDVVTLRHVLVHNGGREVEILAHLSTLLVPGGCVYAVDADVTAGMLSPADPDMSELSDRFIAWHRGRGDDLEAGPHLADRMRAAGLQVEAEHRVVATMPIANGMRGPAWATRSALRDGGLASDRDIARWSAALQRIEASDTRYVGSMPFHIVIGRRR